MFVFGWVLVTLAAAVGASAQSPPAALDWWQTTVFYQVYPRSFKDSNGDGVGDLNGIASKLGYLRDLGVGAVWLSPIFKSPMADFGYDISDFRDIDPVFGTLQDFDNLVAEAKRLGLRVILDFVPNHSSDENEWFVKSVANDPEYRDYYVWRDPKGFDENGKPIPPNNWLSLFLGSAWKYNEQRQQFYLHQFHYKQPDLNYRDPKLVQEMKDVMTFWLDRGVSGFRVDAVPILFEDAEERDEPPSNIPGVSPDDNVSLLHIYTQHQPGSYDMIQQWREVLDQYSKKDNETRVMMTEAYGTIEQTMAYYGTEERRGAHFTFNFNLITNLNSGSHASNADDQIDLWLDNMPPWAWPNWVIGNHDNHRVASRYGSELSDGIIMLSMLLPGTGVSYNGEEIGMLDTNISYADTLDPSGCNAGPDRYQLYSRDPERTPFQWDDSLSAGFSTSNKTWLPVNPNYKQLNVEAQRRANVSHYHMYKSLMRARTTPTIQRGSLQQHVLADSLVLLRELQGEPSFVVVINFADKVTLNLSEAMPTLPSELKVFAASVDSQMTEGMTVPSTAVNLKAKASLVLTTASAI